MPITGKSVSLPSITTNKYMIIETISKLNSDNTTWTLGAVLRAYLDDENGNFVQWVGDPIGFEISDLYAYAADKPDVQAAMGAFISAIVAEATTRGII